MALMANGVTTASSLSAQAWSHPRRCSKPRAGAKSVAPLELARAYSVFANGGNLVYPWIISRVSERGGETLFEPTADDPAPARVASPRNAFVMDSLLQSIVRSGSGHRAAQLGRADVAGKTGTSNAAKDVWFSECEAPAVNGAHMLKRMSVR